MNQDTRNKVRDIFTGYLEKKALRKTPERYAILEEIYSRQGHFDVEALYDSMKENNYRVSRATVYNTLELLEDCDLIVRHQFSNHISEYERSFGSKQHDHLICTDCQKVIEFCDPRIHSIQSKAGDLLNFDIIHHSLILYGKCQKPDCENNKETGSKKSKQPA